VGCNWQPHGSFVLGIEADLSWADSLSSSHQFGPAAIPGGNPPPNNAASSRSEKISNRLNWLTTLRGRVGYAWSNMLIYGTAGLAVADISSRTSVNFSNDAFYLPLFGFTGEAHKTQVGLAAGGGIEYALTDNWTLKSEYLFLDFKSFEYLSNCGTVACGPGNASGFAWSTRVDPQEHILRIGVNYRFNAE
jgi:opacity protein-like surface antigen